MKLRNKKTGEIALIRGTIYVTKENDICCGMGSYNSLAELNEEWEDYEETKDYWYINENGGVLHYIPDDFDGEDLVYNKYQNEIGNHFETKEEAEKAVEKLKAWKRVKDLGFRIKGHEVLNDELTIKYDFSNNKADVDTCAKTLDDVRLLFGDFTNDE